MATTEISEAGLEGALEAATDRVLGTLFGPIESRGDLPRSADGAFVGELAGVLGLTGPQPGLLAVHGTKRTFTTLASLLTGAEAPTDAELRDTAAELANMIGGNLGMYGGEALADVRLALPSVIEGRNYYLDFVGAAHRILRVYGVAGNELVVELALGRERGPRTPTEP